MPRQLGNYIHHRHLLLLLSSKADTHFTVPQGVEGWVDLGGAGYIPRWCTCPQAVTHPSINRAWRRVTLLIETNALPLSQTTTYWMSGYMQSETQKKTWNSIYGMNMCSNSAGGGRELARFPEDLLLMGTIWRWIKKPTIVIGKEMQHKLSVKGTEGTS